MEFTFILTEQEANLIINAIQELPAKLANPLTQKLQKQAQEQVAAKQTAAEPAAE